MPDHRVLTSVEIHEPKHISDSSAADAGKVITPLSGGTSELRNLTAEEVGVLYSYLEVGVDQNTTSFPIVAAVDTDLYDPADYISINSVRVPGGTSDLELGLTWDNVNYTATAVASGIYKFDFRCNIFSSTNNTKVGFSFEKNGLVASGVVKTDLPNLGRVGNLSSSFMFNLAAGDVISFDVAADKSVNLTITDFKILAHILRPL